MFRLLLILSLIVYVVYKVGSFFFRAGAASQQLRDQERKNVNNNVNAQAPKKNKGGSKSGEYIDYEEVK